MKRLLLLLLCALGASAQTMILTPSKITELKARAAANSSEWAILRSACSNVIAYTAGTPDHLPEVYASMEPTSDGGPNGAIRLGTDGNAYQGTNVEDSGYPAALCYLMLKDGDVTPAGWSYTWNGISLTPQQYGLLAGMQAVKILHKTTPPMVHMTPATPPTGWHGLSWRQIDGAALLRMDRENDRLGASGSVDATVATAATSSTTSIGTNTLTFTSTKTPAYAADVFTVGDYVYGPNIPTGTTILTYTPNTSITLSANVTGNIPSGTPIADLPASDSCSASGTSQVFAGSTLGSPYGPSAHAPVVFTNVAGPLGTIMNGNTYYVDPANKTSLPPFSSNTYGFYLDTDAGGTPFCIVPLQGADYKGYKVGSGQNYNHQPQNDNEYPPRFFMTGMALMYDWLHPLLNQSVATILNGLAAQESTAVKNTFTAGGTAWNATTNPWTDSTLTANGNYPQAIPDGFATLQAQVLDSMDCWTRDLLFGFYSGNDVGALVTTMSNYHWGVYSGLGLTGIAAYNDDARGPVWYNYWRNHMHLMVDQPYVARWLGPNGYPMDSQNYAGSAIESVTLTMLSNATAMGDDLISNAAQPFSWITGLEYYKHATDPSGKTMETRGYIYFPGVGTPPCVNCVSTTELVEVQALADYENHPLKDKFRSYAQSQITALGGLSGWQPFLFWNPSGTQTAWNDEPTTLGTLANPAGGYGNVFMRSDWTTSAAYATFYGRSALFDYGNSKDVNDFVGSLTIQRGVNGLSVEAEGECSWRSPATTAGAGSALYDAADNCWSSADSMKGYHGYGTWGAGFYRVKSTTGNPTSSATVSSVTLTTNALTASSSAVLNFASTTGVVTGMVAVGTGIPTAAYVIRISPTTVTLNQNTTGVASSASIIFATVGTFAYGSSGDGDVPGTTLFGSAYYTQPGQDDWSPVNTGSGTPWTPAPTYTVAGSTVTVNPTVPLSFNWGNGSTVKFTWDTTATPPTYYLSGSSGATESVSRATVYLIVNWNSNGTFGIIKAPTTVAHGGSYPTTGTALVFATSGSGNQYIHAQPGILMPEAHPARIDLLESTANYTYARAVGMEGAYSGTRILGSQREVLFLLPKLFLVYDRTRQAHLNQQTASFTSIIDGDGTNPITLVTAGTLMHSGMQVKLTSVSGAGCSALNNQMYTITALDGYRLALNGQTTALGATACTGTITGNMWGHQTIPWTTSAVPTEVTTAGQQSAGVRQWYVAGLPVSIATITNTTPVTLTTSSPHLVNTGFTVNVAGITGACAAALNGTWMVTIPKTGAASDLTTMALNGSTACGTGTVGSSTIQRFNGAITTVKPSSALAYLRDPMLAISQTSGAGLIYQLEVHDPRDCTSNPTWCQAAGADTADSQNWFTALDASQSIAETATVTPLTATNADMVQVSATAVAGFQNSQIASGNCASNTCAAPAPTLPISYTHTPAITNSTHTIGGMTPNTTYKVDTSTPGTVTITASGTGSSVTATANGILTFASAGTSDPIISSLSSSSVTAGSGPFTLNIYGSNFDATAVVAFGTYSPVVTYVGVGQVNAAITAPMIATPGSVSVTVSTTGHSTSAPATFTVNATSAPTIVSLSPSSKTAGAAGFTLTVNGTYYDATAVVNWNGTPLVTTYVNSGQVTAPITSGMVASPGTASVTVSTTTSGQTSSAATFTIGTPPTPGSLVSGKVTVAGAATIK